jgi:hypothetical protein
MAQAESKLSRQIMAALRARGVWCMKIHGGPTMMAGAPDIVACVPVDVELHSGPFGEPAKFGLFVGFETKTPTGGDPTPVQQHVHQGIRNAHGVVFVPRSVEDAVKALQSVGWTDPGE